MTDPTIWLWARAKVAAVLWKARRDAAREFRRMARELKG
jgi:hypothetical protein